MSPEDRERVAEIREALPETYNRTGDGDLRYLLELVERLDRERAELREWMVRRRREANDEAQDAVEEQELLLGGQVIALFHVLRWLDERGGS